MTRGTARRTRRSAGRARIWVPILAALAVVAPLGWLWQASRVPASYSVMDMGYADLGGAPTDHQGHGTGHRSSGSGAPPRLVTDLVADPSQPADVRVELVARQQRIRVAGRELDGFTLNGVTPGPQIRAGQGDLVEVRLRNASVADGVTLHWHGVDVPNAMDGVAGVTQDAVPVGGEFVYRFEVDRSGSYWYHAHQVSNPQVAGGLFGSLVVLPRAALPTDVDVTAVAHTYAGVRTINGAAEDLRVPAAPGQRARVRITNTDNAPLSVWVGGPFRVLAVDGTDLHGPSQVRDRSVGLAAGARVDLEVRVPAGVRTAARIQVSKGTAVIVGPRGATAAEPGRPAQALDLLGYGTPMPADSAPADLDPARASRHFEYVIGRRLGFVRGRPGMWWTINGRLYPHVPMYVVRAGEVATMRLENRSSEVHPMHLHGHRMLVLARDGVPSTGSPWWVDSLDLAPRETYDVAFVADNPGIWMDHCHNLKHAEDGMVAHLMYEGVDTPFRIGAASGNVPE